MKKSLYAVLSLMVVVLLSAFFLPERAGEQTEKKFFGALPSLFYMENETAEQKEDDGIKVDVYITQEKKIRSVPLEEYVAGVVASEMPMSYPSEALNAQAVAARSYALFKTKWYSGEGCLSHPGADVCSSPGCCQGYRPPDDDIYKNAIKAAKDTENLIVTFRNHPIRALYHACSGGHTENAENVYSEALAYLRGVPSPGEEGHPKYGNRTKMHISELEEAFSGDENVVFLMDYPISEQMEILSVSDTGRVMDLRIGLYRISGAEFRKKTALDSSSFQMEFDDEAACVTFVTKGFGHGVGLSQAGAEAMAKGGKTFEQILTHYYSGVSVQNLTEIIKKEDVQRAYVPRYCL